MVAGVAHPGRFAGPTLRNDPELRHEPDELDVRQHVSGS